QNWMCLNGNDDKSVEYLMSDEGCSKSELSVVLSLNVFVALIWCAKVVAFMHVIVRYVFYVRSMYYAS
ncbi:hypothetical protein Tco_0262962, partial [Tanacetum coccineum]